MGSPSLPIGWQRREPGLYERLTKHGFAVVERGERTGFWYWSAPHGIDPAGRGGRCSLLRTAAAKADRVLQDYEAAQYGEVRHG